MTAPGKVVTLTVAGTQYQVTQVGGRTGGQILFRGGQTFAAAMATGLSMKSSDTTVATMMALVRGMSLDDYDWLCDEMAKCTLVGIVDTAGDGRVTFTPLTPALYDSHFRGKYMAQMDWLKGALEANFGDFFVELQGRFTAWAAATASVSKAPTVPAASGGSGASSSPSA